MPPVDAVIRDAVQRIQRNEQRLQNASHQLKKLKEKDLLQESEVFLEPQLVRSIPKAELHGTVAGVDSGFLPIELRSLYIILVRAMGTLFHYNRGKLVVAEPYPTSFKFPEPTLITESLERDEFACSTSLHRLREEMGTARLLLEEKKPQYLLLDGSLVPQISDKPRKESKVKDLYHAILGEFQNLYKSAKKHGSTIIACVEDSKGTRFRSMLQENIRSIPPSDLNGFFDAALLNDVLQVGERSMAFSYSENVSQHPVLSDLKEGWGEQLYACYVKTARFDWPIRIEFFSERSELTKTADSLSSIVYSLSSQHKEYAFPSVLIEADLRARLKPEEVSLVYDTILDKIGNSLYLQQRRNKRPF